MKTTQQKMTCAYCKEVNLKKQQQRFCSVVCYGLYIREHGKTSKGFAVPSNFEKMTGNVPSPMTTTDELVATTEKPASEKQKPKVHSKTYFDYLDEAVAIGQLHEEEAINGKKTLRSLKRYF